MNNKISRRRFLLRSGKGLLALALLAGCGQAPRPTPTAPPTAAGTALPTPAAPTATATATEEPRPTQTTAPAVDLDYKIGQMIMVGFRGLTLTEDNPVVEDIRARHIGGVILFDYDMAEQSPVRNIQSPEQLQALDASLQAVAPSPLLIAVDQEGGQVARLKEQYGFPPTVSAQYLGTLNDLNVTHQYALSIAQTLAAAGINLNFAPVVDLNVNPDNPIIGRLERSFSADPQVVTAHALEFVRAHHEAGVLTTLKHFPGHGSSKTDSHLGFVDVTDSWSPVELEPYRAIIAAGESDLIMTAHIYNANLDPDYPATLSHAVVTGLLRRDLGYNGPVISDDMQMQAITDRYGFEEAIELAINAGVDILEYANNTVFDPEAASKAIAAIKQLVEQGQVSPERIEESYQRIIQFKGRS